MKDIIVPTADTRIKAIYKQILAIIAVIAFCSSITVPLVMKLKNGRYLELKQSLKKFLHDPNAWTPVLQDGKGLPEQVTMGITVKAWGIENSLTGFAAISFCGLYLSIIFIILSSTILAFEQLSKIDYNRRNYQILDKMGVAQKTRRNLINCLLYTSRCV